MTVVIQVTIKKNRIKKITIAVFWTKCTLEEMCFSDFNIRYVFMSYFVF